MANMARHDSDATASSTTAGTPNSSPVADIERGGPEPAELKRRRPDAAQADEKRPDPKTREWENDVVTWDSDDDPENPMNWPRSKKMRVTMLMGITTMSSTFASSIFSASAPYIARDYGISEEVSILGLSLFLLGFVVGPILFGPASELLGRRYTLIIPVFVFACFSAATATAQNIQTIFITRFFGGMFAASPVTIVGGGLADFWNQRDRGAAIVIYSLCIVGGPTVAPTIGAAVSESYLTWRWTEYLCVILTGAVVIMDVFWLPETSARIILARKAQRLRIETKRWALHAKSEEQSKTVHDFVHQTLLLPLTMLVKEPMVLLVTTYNGFAYGILYMLFVSGSMIARTRADERLRFPSSSRSTAGGPLFLRLYPTWRPLSAPSLRPLSTMCTRRTTLSATSTHTTARRPRRSACRLWQLAVLLFPSASSSSAGRALRRSTGSPRSLASASSE